MDPQKQKTLEAWLKEQAKIKSRSRRKKKLDDEGGVTINSLMDAVTIILIFLLMNFSTDPMKVTPHEKLQLPISTTLLKAKEKTATITITADGIIVNDGKDGELATIKNGEVDTSDSQSLELANLRAALDKVVEEGKLWAAAHKRTYKDIVTIIVHGETQYHIVTKVVYTAGLASFTKFKFAVVKGGQLRQSL